MPELELEIDHVRKLVTARVPWDAVAKMSNEQAAHLLHKLVELRREWEAKGYKLYY